MAEGRGTASHNALNQPEVMVPFGALVGVVRPSGHFSGGDEVGVTDPSGFSIPP
jgi:hypothetical protein